MLGTSALTSSPSTCRPRDRVRGGRVGSPRYTVCVEVAPALLAPGNRSSPCFFSLGVLCFSVLPVRRGSRTRGLTLSYSLCIRRAFARLCFPLGTKASGLYAVLWTATQLVVDWCARGRWIFDLRTLLSAVVLFALHGLSHGLFCGGVCPVP